jgi:purine-binding chemotaxis protein CheW
MGQSIRVSHRLYVVVFVIDGHRHALPLLAVERVVSMVEVTPLPGAPPITLGVIDVHGALLPVVDLRVRFALSRAPYGADSQLVLVRTPRRRLAVAVERVAGVAELAADAVTAATALPPARGLAGLATLADGLVLIHDLDSVLSLDEEHDLSRALEAATG